VLGPVIYYYLVICNKDRTHSTHKLKRIF